MSLKPNVGPYSVSQGLPKKIRSLCPECIAVVPGRLFEENGMVMIEKECPDHGSTKDVYWSDAELYHRAESWGVDGHGVLNPQLEASADQCPDACGICSSHHSSTNLANIDLTNRCNLLCPVCFANANESGYVFEPTFDEVVKMMEVLRAQKPVATPAIQFSGGEPTIYPRFIDVVQRASELGFGQIQVATNGIKLAQDKDLAQKMVSAGMHTVYLQFDGLREQDYKAARGVPLLQTKLKAIEACRNTKPAPLATVLVPTILKTINDDQVGPMLEFAIENRDVIRGVNYQPVAFTGRIDQDVRERERYTLPDLANDLSEQTGFLTKDDFYPVPSVTAISRLVNAIHEPRVAFSAHPHCGIATFLVIDEQGKATPITRMVDVDGLLRKMWEMADKAETTMGQVALSMGKKLSKIRSEEKKAEAVRKKFKDYFGEYIIEDTLPGGVSIYDVLMTLTAKPDKEPLRDFAWSSMFVGGMHFQDNYNYDIDRVMRCVIHYAVPDGRVIPFCAYNGGPTYRTEIEKEFSIPIDEWKQRNKELDVPTFSGDA